jgi:hypothetical protein
LINSNRPKSSSSTNMEGLGYFMLIGRYKQNFGEIAEEVTQ